MEVELSAVRLELTRSHRLETLKDGTKILRLTA